MSYPPTPPTAPSSGMDPKLAGLLAYVIPPITGIVFLLIEKTNDVVRWHAAQSIVFGVAWIVMWIVLMVLSTVLSTVIPVIGWVISMLVYVVICLGGLVMWVICLIKGYSGTKWRMPLLAPYADKVIASGAGRSAS